MKKVRRILALDGGGIRGLASAQFLTRAWDRLGDFDMYAGTSTGGIIALALAQHIQPFQIVGYYQDECRQIFKRNWLDRFRVLKSSRYRNDSLRASLERLLRCKSLNLLSKDVFIPSHEATSNQAYFFTRESHGDGFGVVDAALATSAAPTFFPRFKKNGQVFVDGGLYANNPSLFAYAEAKKKWPDADVIEIVNIGTGAGPSKKLAEADHVIDSAVAVFGMSLDGAANTAEYVCRHSLPDCHFTRFTFDYPFDIKLDNVDKDVLDVLVDTANKRYMEAHRLGEFDAFGGGLAA